MVNLRYEFARLRTDYYLSGVSERYRQGRPLAPPRYVIWDCTRRCNLYCAHCGAADENYPAELSTAQVRGLIDQLADLRVDMFAVTGGEPLLRSDLLELLAYASQCGLRTGIASNGYRVDERLAREIQAASVTSVQISLDGCEATHNAIRGNPQSFGHALRAIDLLTHADIPILSAATTVTPRNLDELPALQALLAAHGVKLWRLAAVMPIGRARGNGLSPGQLERLFQFVDRQRGRTPRVYLGENLTYLGRWEKKLRSAPQICPIGFTACCIGVDGHVRGCPEQPDRPENREGSLLETPLAEIWQHGFARYRRREVLQQDPHCRQCAARSICYGGCWVMREEGQHCIPEHGLAELTDRIDPRRR